MNYIADALSRNYNRPSTSTEEEDYIRQSIHNSILQRAPSLPTPPNTITCNHFSIPPLTPEMSEYQSSSASDFSYTNCEYNLCRSRGKPTGHHHCCPYQDDDDWEQFITYPEYTEFQEASPPANPQSEPECEPLTPIDPAIFDGYTPFTVEQIGVEAYQEDLGRMYDHNK